MPFTEAMSQLIVLRASPVVRRGSAPSKEVEQAIRPRAKRSEVEIRKEKRPQRGLRSLRHVRTPGLLARNWHGERNEFVSGGATF
jgi:hypothetical protein